MLEPEDKYWILFERNPLPMWIYDVQTLAFLAANDAAVHHYGYSREEYLRMTPFDLTAVEDIPRLKQIFDKVLGTESQCHGVWRHRKKDGSIIFAEISSQSLQYQGRACRLALANDISRLYSAAEQLQLLETCLNRLNDVVIITEGEPIEEPGPKIIYVNDAFVRRTGYTREEALGRSPRFMQGPKSSMVVLERVWSTLKQGRSVREEVAKYTKSGQEIWWELEITPVADESGCCRYFVAIERDITDRRRAERALRKSEARLKEAQRVANIGSWEWNLRERKVIWSDELFRIFGLAPQSITITAEAFLSLIHPEERAVMGRKIELMRSHPRTFTETFRILLPSGGTRYVLAHGEAARDGGTQPVRLLGTVQDVTERHQAEQARLQAARLEAVNRELEAFSYSVSHDLRAPLRTIDGFAKMLAEDCGPKLDEEGRGYLTHIQDAARRMGQLIQDLLDLSQITTSEMRRVKVDLSAMVDLIVAELREADPQRQVQIKVAPSLTVSADPRLLRIAVENLLRNAWKFTGKTPNPSIEFGSFMKDGEPVYFVRDNGAGFDMEFAPKLFGVFQRLHRETEFPGTGVGLATVQRILNRHGGKIWAEGVPDKGATFYFTFPNGIAPTTLSRSSGNPKAR